MTYVYIDPKFGKLKCPNCNGSFQWKLKHWKSWLKNTSLKCPKCKSKIKFAKKNNFKAVIIKTAILSLTMYLMIFISNTYINNDETEFIFLCLGLFGSIYIWKKSITSSDGYIHLVHEIKS